MNVLPRKTQLGYLKFYEIYEDAFGPKCFSVKNELDHLFLVYWSGGTQDENGSDWAYIPVSNQILDALRREEDSFHNVFNASKNYYHVTTYGGLNDRRDTVISLGKDSLSDLNLPPKEFKINVKGIKSVAPESQWDLNLKIAKRSSSNSPESSIVTRIMDAFGDVIESLMRDAGHKYPRLIPLTASYGSFDVKLGSSSNERASVALEQLSTLLDKPNSIDEDLKTLNLDPYKLKSLLDLASLNSLNLTIKPKTSEFFSKEIKIESEKIKPLVEKLEKSAVTFIDSRKVPQANCLDRVVAIVKLRAEGALLNVESIDGLSSDRQVAYYTHAAWCLGLLNRNMTVASPGRVLCSLKNKIAEYQFLAERFQSSDFGWAWMKWAKVDDIGDLEPDSAENFVQECVRGLNDATASRRATSLASWLKVLREHRRVYAGDE